MKICSKSRRTPIPKSDFNKVALQLYWNHFLVWVFSCKFGAYFQNNRSSHQRCSMKKGVLRNFTKFAGKHQWPSLLFNKVTGPKPATLLKKRLWHRFFLVNFAEFLRISFLRNIFGRLLLEHLYRRTPLGGCFCSLLPFIWKDM